MLFLSSFCLPARIAPVYPYPRPRRRFTARALPLARPGTSPFLFYVPVNGTGPLRLPDICLLLLWWVGERRPLRWVPALQENTMIS